MALLAAALSPSNGVHIETPNFLRDVTAVSVQGYLLYLVIREVGFREEGSTDNTKAVLISWRNKSSPIRINFVRILL